MPDWTIREGETKGRGGRALARKNSIELWNNGERG